MSGVGNEPGIATAIVWIEVNRHPAQQGIRHLARRDTLRMHMRLERRYIATTISGQIAPEHVQRIATFSHRPRPEVLSHAGREQRRRFTRWCGGDVFLQLLRVVQRGDKEDTARHRLMVSIGYHQTPISNGHYMADDHKLSTAPTRHTCNRYNNAGLHTQAMDT